MSLAKKRQSSYNNSPILKSDSLQCNMLGRWSHQPSVWWSKYYFDRLKIKHWVAGLDLGHSKLFIFVKLYIKKEKEIERIFAKNFARNYEKKIILGTSYTWSMRRSSHRPSDQAYYIEDCRMFIPSIISSQNVLYSLSVVIGRDFAQTHQCSVQGSVRM